MPRLARQWHTLTGHLCRAQWPALAAAVRSYAQKTTPPTEPFKGARPLNSAIIIPACVNDADSNHLISYIRPVTRENLARDTFCVVLVTPSFAPWLSKESDFLWRALRRTYSAAFDRVTGRLAVHVLCAVVDKLPAGRTIDTTTTLHEEMATRKIRPPVGHVGYEGIAVATLPASASILSTSPRSAQRGAIDFVFSRGTPDNKVCSETWRVPLANTVFQTGSPSTMFFSRWSIVGQDKSSEMEHEVDVSHHTVRMTSATSPVSKVASALGIPLVPLTLPRRVEGCMGNIIRSVIGEDGVPTTASSELEYAVPQYFKSRSEPAQPTTAWALVMPKPMTDLQRGRTTRLLTRQMSTSEKGTQMLEVLWERLWKRDPPVWNGVVQGALGEGARLHRVLSGGGGWGKKAGLLSLDPVPLGEEIPIRMEDASSSFEGPGDFSSALTPVVKDGDAIQFFISPNTGKLAEEEGYLKQIKLMEIPKLDTLGWELGTIPSTVDSIPGGSWQHHGSDDDYVAVFRGCFGALSESGLTLTRHVQANKDQSPPLDGTTTVDVPFSRFSMIELAEKHDLAKDSIHKHQARHAGRPSEPGRQHLQHSHQPSGSAGPETFPPPVVRRVLIDISDAALVQHNHSATITRETRAYRMPAEQAVRELGDVRLTNQPKNTTLVRKYTRADTNPRQEKKIRAVESDAHRGVESKIRKFTSGSVSDPRKLTSGSGSGFRKLTSDFGLNFDVARIERRLSAISMSVRSLKNTLFRLLPLFRYWHLVYSTNALAFQTYGLHVALRMRIGKMIHARHRSRRKHAVRRLKHRLLALRAYDGVLFYNKPGWTREYVKERLEALEMRRRTQRILAVNTQVVTEQVARRIRPVNDQARRWARRGRSERAAVRKVAIGSAHSFTRGMHKIEPMALKERVESSPRRIRRVQSERQRIRKHVVATPGGHISGGNQEFRKVDSYKLVASRVVARRWRRVERRTAQRALQRELLAAKVSSWLGGVGPGSKHRVDSGKARVFGSQLQGSDGKVGEE